MPKNSFRLNLFVHADAQGTEEWWRRKTKTFTFFVESGDSCTTVNPPTRVLSRSSVPLFSSADQQSPAGSAVCTVNRRLKGYNSTVKSQIDGRKTIKKKPLRLRESAGLNCVDHVVVSSQVCCVLSFLSSSSLCCCQIHEPT